VVSISSKKICDDEELGENSCYDENCDVRDMEATSVLVSSKHKLASTEG
jgi:hypothetical protein